MYGLIRPLLFALPPEIAHAISMKVWDWISLPYAKFNPVLQKPCKVMGIEFPNPVGLAAGFDKDGKHVISLSRMGFGFLELGTVTPKPQAGNPHPRLFRLKKEKALINRMGFNNEGVDALVERLRKIPNKPIIGINIGKNKSTPDEAAINDYIECLNKVYADADYITINISSPNTPGLRNLQSEKYLMPLLETLKQQQSRLKSEYQRYVPLVVKVAPDLNESEIKQMANCFLQAEIDGVIATNTTIKRYQIENALAKEAGGLSGMPLFDLSTQALKLFKQQLGNKIPLIAVGGILSAEQAREKIVAGADLIQLYTGLIYGGIKLVRECVNDLE